MAIRRGNMGAAPMTTIICAFGVAACASSTSIQTNVPAKVYVDGVHVGTTPYQMTDTKPSGSTTMVRLEAPGYEPLHTHISRNEEIDPMALVGGVVALVPFLWLMKYSPIHSYELKPAGAPGGVARTIPASASSLPPAIEAPTPAPGAPPSPARRGARVTPANQVAVAPTRPEPATVAPVPHESPATRVASTCPPANWRIAPTGVPSREGASSIDFQAAMLGMMGFQPPSSLGAGPPHADRHCRTGCCTSCGAVVRQATQCPDQSCVEGLMANLTSYGRTALAAYLSCARQGGVDNEVCFPDLTWCFTEMAMPESTALLGSWRTGRLTYQFHPRGRYESMNIQTGQACTYQVGTYELADGAVTLRAREVTFSVYHPAYGCRRGRAEPVSTVTRIPFTVRTLPTPNGQLSAGDVIMYFPDHPKGVLFERVKP